MIGLAQRGVAGLPDLWDTKWAEFPDEPMQLDWTEARYADFLAAREDFIRLFNAARSLLDKPYHWTVEGVSGKIAEIGAFQEYFVQYVQDHNLHLRTAQGYSVQIAWLSSAFRQAREILDAELITAQEMEADAEVGTGFDLGGLLKPPTLYYVLAGAGLLLFMGKR